MRDFDLNESQAQERLVCFQMVDSDREPLTGLTVIVEILKASAGAYAAIGGSVAEISDGTYRASLAMADVDVEGEAMLKATAAGAVNQYIPIRIKQQIVANLTVGAITASRDVANRLSSPITLEMFQLEEKAFAITCLDAEESAVDLEGRTLRFVVQDSNDPPNAKFEAEGSDIVVSGESNEIATVMIDATKSATASLEYHWRLWDLDNDQVLAYGAFKIHPSIKDVT